MSRYKTAVVWAALLAAIIVPMALSALSPQLAWRGPAYIVAGFAGVLGLALLLLQPLLAGRFLPGLSPLRTRYFHRIVGSLLVFAVVVHVGGLWVTTAPDVIDALLFRSPTPFSVWGVVAMWAVFAAALLAATRKRIRLRWSTWRLSHAGLALVTVVGTVVHAMLIEGTMELISKTVLCGLVLIATGVLLFSLWKKGTRKIV
ncbi:ferric reductase-like transmembrane domain-containing protein [Pseudahrensia aquimaris]|uniref:Ferric reductase-like transmembrane domain-containing protein n=1 Tax=Pseudahrensia aquimaris TaxID=744461 RepID=A0ABW3FCJ7_9HYPH